jgi:tRNA pseudouridine55 synthase
MHHDVSGVICVAKPAGVTSRRVVDAIAKALGTKSVGHAGTLDPLATGVVVVCVGHATKLVDYVHELPKHYLGSFLLGRSSPSDDLETPVDDEPCPVRPSRAEIQAALPAFRGAILQRPCDYSAVHVAGQRAYRIARKGTPIEMEAKPVHIARLEITDYEWPRLGLTIECSSGTFVRAIGRDLAAALGTRAVMESLVRTAVGPFTIDTALALDDVTPESARAALLPPAEAVAHLPAVTFHAETLALAIRGDLLDIDTPAAAAAALDGAGDLVGIVRRHESGRHRLKPNFRGRG